MSRGMCILPVQPLATTFHYRLVPVALAFVLASWSGVGCRQAPPPPPAKTVLRVATAFAPLSTRLTEEYRRTMPDLDIQEPQAVSSLDVLRMIQNDTLDFGVALADDAYRAHFGHSGDAASSEVRGISLLQPLPMYLLVRAGSNVRSVSDLDGRVVATGPINTSSWTLGTLVLKAFKVESVTIKPVNSREVAAQGLKDGSLDAIVLPGYVYPDEVTLAVIRDGAYLLPIDGPPVEQLRRESPFVRVVMIPRRHLPGTGQDHPDRRHRHAHRLQTQSGRSTRLPTHRTTLHGVPAARARRSDHAVPESG